MANDTGPQMLSPEVVELQKVAFNALTLVNGGAIVAILTFVGNLLSESASQSLPIDLKWILGALGLFAAGAALSIMATIAGLFWAHALTNTLPAPRFVMTYSVKSYLWLLAGSGLCFSLGGIAALISMFPC